MDFKLKPKLLPLLFLGVLLSNAQNPSSQDFDLSAFFSPTKAIKYEDPKTAIATLKEAQAAYLKQGDSIKSITALLHMADIYGHSADYANSYDAFWKSLRIADEMHNDSLNIHISMRLGRFYSFYKKVDESFKYLENSLALAKKRVAEGKMDQAYLVENYSTFLSTYRELNRPEMAEKYLDSCLLYYKDVPSQVPMAQLNFEKAVILSQKGQNEEALKTMESIEAWYEEHRPSYLVLIYTYWGDILQNTNALNQSEKYYQKALEVSSNYQGHIDFTPLIYERLANLYLKKGNYQEAFANQKTAKDLDAKFFDSRSTNNRSLLEIKDEFRLEKQAQEALIQKQRVEQLEQEEEISFLQRVILSVIIIFILSVGFIFFKNLQNKHKIEKELIRRNKELEIQKANELLELKNKELAASALQLVEKDEFLKELKTKLRGGGENMKVSEMNKILRTISISNNNNWEEFKLRFTAVNEKFYQKLTQKYPKLSQSDHKICALIKLNFSSKDMSRLLGISVESVHTTRYRLRKKLGLERSSNLEDFIASL